MNNPRPIVVSLDADHVLSPVVRYGDPFTAIFFPIEPTADSETAMFGSVTFEGLDSIRCSRGEYFPYKPQAGESWIQEIGDSEWLNERHAYEYKFYKTPLLEDYHHYVFCFHDQFVEAIANGIWVERIASKITDEISTDHPLNDLPTSLSAEFFEIDGLHSELRKNPQHLVETIKASELCSQKLFQFYLTLDGERAPSYAAELRTLRGKSVTRFRADWPHRDLITVQGVAKVEDVLPAWKQYVSEVAKRRKEMGKHD